MPKIGNLSTSLTLESQSFFVELARVNAKTQSSVLGIQKSLSRVATGVTAAFSAIGGSVLVSAAKRALDYAGSLGEVSQQLGVTSRDLQLFRFVGSQVGVENAEMDKGLQKLTRTMGEADAGSKKQAMAFRELGVSVRDANGNLLTAGQVLPKLADAFAQLKDPATRARYETALFGKTGQQLDPLLTQGAQGVAALTAEAERLGIVIGDDLIAKADEASDKLAVLSQVLESQLAITVAQNADAISALADELMRAASSAGTFIRSIRGTARIMREEGFFAGLGEANSVDAATPQGWFDRKQRQLMDAEKRLRQAKDKGIPARGLFQFQQQRDQALAARDKASGELMTAAFGSKRAVSTADTKGALPTAKGGGRGKRDRSADYLERFEKELDQLKQQELRLQQQLTTSIDERVQLQQKAIRDEQTAYDEDVDRRVKEGELTAAQAEELKFAYAANAAKEQNVVWNEGEAEKARESLKLATARLDLQTELLQGELANAVTADQRAAVETQLLDRAFEKRRLEDENIVAMFKINKATDEEATAAEERLARLDQLKKIEQARIDRSQAIGLLEERADLIDRDIELGRLRGDSEASMRARESGSRALRREAELIGEGTDPVAAKAQAEREAFEMNRAFNQGYWRDTFKGGFRAALDGDFGGWFENWWKDRISSALEDALNSVADLIAQLFKVDASGGAGGASGIGGILASIFGGGGGGGLQGAANAATAGANSMGGRAGGGPVLPGRSYHIGERGPEMFTPNRSGFITPSRAGAGQSRGNVTIYANDAVLASTVKQWVTEGMLAAEQGAVARSARANFRQEQRRLGRR